MKKKLIDVWQITSVKDMKKNRLNLNARHAKTFNFW